MIDDLFENEIYVYAIVSAKGTVIIKPAVIDKKNTATVRKAIMKVEHNALSARSAIMQPRVQ